MSNPQHSGFLQYTTTTIILQLATIIYTGTMRGISIWKERTNQAWSPLGMQPQAWSLCTLRLPAATLSFGDATFVLCKSSMRIQRKRLVMIHQLLQLHFERCLKNSAPFCLRGWSHAGNVESPVTTFGWNWPKPSQSKELHRTQGCQCAIAFEYDTPNFKFEKWTNIRISSVNLMHSLIAENNIKTKMWWKPLWGPP